jgi:hypothetical protein
MKEEATSAFLKVIFSRRGGTNYQSMTEYLELMRDGREKLQPVRSINWRILDIDSIKVENHSKWAGLQIADIATSAFFAAVEPNAYGNYEPRYALELSRRLISANGSVLDCGITPIPKLGKNPLTPQQQRFFEDVKKK